MKEMIAVGFGVCGSDDEAINAAFQERLDNIVFLFGEAVGAGEEHRIAVLLRGLIDSFQDVRVESAGQAAEDDADGFGFAEAEAASEAVGPITNFFGDFEDFFSGLFADAAGFAKGIMDGGFGDAKALCDGFHVQGFVGFHEGKLVGPGRVKHFLLNHSSESDRHFSMKKSFTVEKSGSIHTKHSRKYA